MNYPTYTGSMDEQLAEIEVDVNLGRLTAQQAFSYTRDLLLNNFERESLLDELECEVEEMRWYEKECQKLEDKIEDLELEIKNLKSNRGQ